MSAHTPGPWVVHQRPNEPIEYGHHVTTADGLTVCSVTYQLPESVDGKVVEARRIANARLIAAAPELLEALGTLAAFPLESFNYANDPDSKEIFGANGEWTLTVGVIRKARAAIAKATGEAQ